MLPQGGFYQGLANNLAHPPAHRHPGFVSGINDPKPNIRFHLRPIHEPDFDSAAHRRTKYLKGSFNLLAFRHLLANDQSDGIPAAIPFDEIQ